MSETRKTATFGIVAVALALAALLTTPGRATPDDFLDRGEPFFPEFTDPNTATTLEVIDFDAETATARPFKVTFKDGRWTIPSHYDYPADGADRLAETAAGLIGIVKDDYRSSNAADHESFGVVGPLDDTATSLEGRGQRITLRDARDRVLADLIVGDPVEGRPNMRFVRVPDQARVYVSRMDLEISTRFEDWIERDLLQLTRDDVLQITLKDYSIDERTGILDNRDTLVLDRDEDGSGWTANQMASGEEVATDSMNDLLGALDTLSIVGVRPKPEGLSASLTRLSTAGLQITQADLLSLQSRGYYFAQSGQLVSNEGELELRAADGVVYALRFGEVVYGEGDAVTAGTEASDDPDSGPGENRYLFVTAAFDPAMLPEPSRPANTDFLDKSDDEWSDEDRENKELQDAHDAWDAAMEAGRQRSDDLNARFADWYYVISSDSFDRIRRNRSDLVREAES